MQNLSENKKIDCHAKNSGSVLEYNFKWTLEDFSYFKYLEKIESPRFYPELNIPWFLTFFKGNHRKPDTWYLILHRGDGYERVKTDCSICISVDNTIVLKRETVYPTIYNPEFPMITITDDEISNFMEFTLQIKRYRQNSSQLDTNIGYSCLSEDEFKRDIQKVMMDDFEKLYENHLNTDIQLSIDGETLEVHKSVLIARSPIFAKMLQQEMMESTNNVIVIKDVNMSAMKEVVAFMYGKARRDYDYDTAMEVYYAADKYGLKQLQEICACILVSNLNMENAYQTLQLADRHYDKGLTKKVIHFITFHSTDEASVAENMLNRAEKK